MTSMKIHFINQMFSLITSGEKKHETFIIVPAESECRISLSI